MQPAQGSDAERQGDRMTRELAMGSARRGLLAALVPFATAHVQAVADHLKCYRIKDPLPRAPSTADLGGLVAEPGCTIRVPATMACVPSTKANVTPCPPYNCACQ
jgi:hypothetical protein